MIPSSGLVIKFILENHGTNYWLSAWGGEDGILVQHSAAKVVVNYVTDWLIVRLVHLDFGYE